MRRIGGICRAGCFAHNHPLSSVACNRAYIVDDSFGGHYLRNFFSSIGFTFGSNLGTRCVVVGGFCGHYGYSFGKFFSF